MRAFFALIAITEVGELEALVFRNGLFRASCVFARGWGAGGAAKGHLTIGDCGWSGNVERESVRTGVKSIAEAVGGTRPRAGAFDR